MDRALSLLKDLIAVDSVNPSLVPGAKGEADVARAIAEAMRAMGLKVEIQDVAPGRPNVVGTLDGRAPGRSLMFCGHIDTVGVSGMSAPFDPVEKSGRIYGRGSQDMKSGVAAMIDAARVIAEGGGPEAGKLIVACVVDEEHASIGADALVTRWRADAAVVTEPTDLQVAIAHKGFEWVEIETEGVAAHGSRPREGRDAIRLMGRVLNGLDQLDRRLQSRTPHELLGTGSLHASLIEGGRELSSYPDRCHLQMERRTIPGEAPGTAAREVEELLGRLRAEDPEFKGASRPMFARSPYQIPADHDLPKAMLRAAGSSAPAIGMSFWTDAAVLADAGIPSILYGPAGAGLHSVEEWVDARSVVTCRDSLVALAREFTVHS
jgi:acetylornithine deacetylase